MINLTWPGTRFPSPTLSTGRPRSFIIGTPGLLPLLRRGLRSSPSILGKLRTGDAAISFSFFLCFLALLIINITCTASFRPKWETVVRGPLISRKQPSAWMKVFEVWSRSLMSPPRRLIPASFGSGLASRSLGKLFKEEASYLLDLDDSTTLNKHVTTTFALCQSRPDKSHTFW